MSAVFKYVGFDRNTVVCQTRTEVNLPVSYKLYIVCFCNVIAFAKYFTCIEWVHSITIFTDTIVSC